jgi:predicted esterase
VANVLHLETTTHGRIVLDAAAELPARGIVVAFHGYGQNAEDALDEIRRIVGSRPWHVAGVQALHPFYARQKVVASWMTREDRDLAIADNVRYVDQAIEAVLRHFERQVTSRQPLVLFGFSQGVAMAYRAALLGRFPVAGVIALAGDIPPELTGASRPWPPLLIGAGNTDSFYTADKLSVDLAFLNARGIVHHVVRFTGGHEPTDEFRREAGDWLDKVAGHK